MLTVYQPKTVTAARDAITDGGNVREGSPRKGGLARGLCTGQTLLQAIRWPWRRTANFTNHRMLLRKRLVLMRRDIAKMRIHEC
jgi:hypothetical protein